MLPGTSSDPGTDVGGDNGDSGLMVAAFSQAFQASGASQQWWAQFTIGRGYKHRLGENRQEASKATSASGKNSGRGHYDRSQPP
jgi:hypothetical protein